MSHVATIEIEVKDLDALQQACDRLGLELVRGQSTYRCWYTTTKAEFRDEVMKQRRWTVESLVPAGFAASDIGRCEHAIRLPGDDDASEIGIVRRRDGRPGFALLIEDMPDAMHDIVGARWANLRREYANVVARKQALAQGFAVNEVRQADGSIHLMLRK
jgi:hypothetical protein